MNIDPMVTSPLAGELMSILAEDDDSLGLCALDLSANDMLLAGVIRMSTVSCPAAESGRLNTCP